MFRLLFILIVIAINAFAEAPQSTGDPKTQPTKNSTFIPNIEPNLNLTFRNGAIHIDGNLDDEGWKQVSKATNFTETYPGNQVKPPVETEAWFTYDEDYLYVAIIAESGPTPVRASLRDRDEIFQDDYVGLLFDTYGTASWYYEIFVNPLGVQGDLIATSNNEDAGADFIFYSEGKLTDNGYQVEIAIPFSSLRFPDRDIHSWKLTVWRDHKADSRRRYSWATINNDKNCFPCQFGTISGMSEIKSSSNLEILPSFISSRSLMLKDYSQPEDGLKVGPTLGDFGMNARYMVNPNLVAELTYNPDFSQIESDAAQIDVNNTFGVFYSERRPFFQEGSDLYQGGFRVVHTRNINNPIFAGKLTGRFNQTNFIFLTAKDENSPLSVPLEERTIRGVAGESYSNIFRLLHNFSDGSSLGGIVTHRSLSEGGSNLVGGVDGKLNFWESWVATGQVLISETQESDSTSAFNYRLSKTPTGGKESFTPYQDGENLSGLALRANLSRFDRQFGVELSANQISSAFRADNGFISGNNSRTVNLFSRYQFWFDQNDYLNKIGIGGFTGMKHNLDDVLKDEWIGTWINFDMKNQNSLHIEMMFNNERFGGILFKDANRLSINYNNNYFQWLSGGFFYQHGRQIFRSNQPELGKGNYVEFWANVKPSEQLSLWLEWSYQELFHARNDETFFIGYILRGGSKFQFTREMSARLILEYNHFSETFSFEPLISYKLNPFSVFYIGASNRASDFGSEKGWFTTDRVYFTKFQFLFTI